MASKLISRRQFVKASAAAGVFSVLPRRVVGGAGHTPPSEQLRIGGIGVGSQGTGNLRNCTGQAVVALCDVDHAYAGDTFKQYPDAKIYTDYREMLERQQDMDAVIVATPDHTHASITLAAMEAGLHVYTQKPLTHDIYEARVLAKAAARTGVTTQMGIQGHSGEGIRLISEWIRDGAIGEVREVDAWCSLSYYPFGHASWSSKWSGRPENAVAPPKTLDWDLWLGPAPMRPYHPAYHPRTWRCWWDFGCGMMGDRGAHTLDPVKTALKLGDPLEVSASVMGGNEETHPLAAIVNFTFGARAGMPPVKLTWYEGLEPPRPKELEDGRRLPAEGGVLFKGTKGTLMCGVYGESPRLIPETAMQDYKRPERTLPRVETNHELEWVEACKRGEPGNAHFGYAGPLTETALLGNVAKRFPGERLVWDAKNLRVTNHEEANAWVKRPRREGWEL